MHKCTVGRQPFKDCYLDPDFFTRRWGLLSFFLFTGLAGRNYWVGDCLEDGLGCVVVFFYDFRFGRVSSVVCCMPSFSQIVSVYFLDTYLFSLRNPLKIICRPTVRLTPILHPSVVKFLFLFIGCPFFWLAVHEISETAVSLYLLWQKLNPRNK